MPDRRSLFALLLALAWGPACDGTPAAATARAQESGNEAPLPTVRGVGREGGDPLLARKLAAADPQGDDWETEVWNESLGKRLKELGHLDWSVVEASELRSFAVDDVAVRSVAPSDLGDVLRSNLWTVQRGRSAGEPGRGVAALAQGLRDLARSPGLEPHFKIVTVRPEDGSVLAEGLFSADPVGGTGSLQLRGRFHTLWTTEDPPRLVEFEVDQLEQVSLPDAQAPLFVDVTASVLGGDPSFELQLLPPLETWAARVDVSLGMSLIGHEGLALGDVNGDGLDDLFVCQPGGLPNRLWLHQPDGTAREVSRAAGVDHLDPSRSALFVDLDDDGDQDLLVEMEPIVLALENDGRGTFTVRAELPAENVTSLAAADFDLDGDLDLYACGYMLPDTRERSPIPYHDANNGRPNVLLRNDLAAGEWTFTDVTREVGLGVNNRRYSFAASWEDYDQDGDPDLYVANDFGRNNLYRNDGGHFTDVAAAAGVEDMAAGMGVSWADYDRDGRWDLYVSNMFSSAGGRVAYQRRFQTGVPEATRAQFQRHARGNTLFRGLPDGRFEDLSEELGVTLGRWAWGAIFTDLDADGWPDLFVPNGFVTGAHSSSDL